MNLSHRDFEFNRMEFAGSLGDLGTLIPLSVAMVVLTGLSVSTVFLLVGLFYLGGGLYFRLPVPVQPLKLVAAIAIAYPDRVTIPVLSATALCFGFLLILLAVTGVVDRLARLFTRPVVRGIQVGLGMILIGKGLGFITGAQLFVGPGAAAVANEWLNPAIGTGGFVIALVLLHNRRFPAALVLVTAGMILGIGFGALHHVDLRLGPTPVELHLPAVSDLITAITLLVLPQMPLTLGNAVVGTADTCLTLFGRNGRTRRATPRAFATSMGLVNLVVGLFGGMPMCHGAGGLAAHHRFGARTGGSNIMIGLAFVVIALGFGRIAIDLLSAIPASILGILLLYAGLELALLIRDVTDKADLFVVFLIAGIGWATSHMGIAFVSGIAVHWLIRWRQLEL